MSDFMIQYINRFKNRFLQAIERLLQNPLPNSILHELQLTRARRVVNAANVIIAMGPNAVHVDVEKFETWRTILMMNNMAFNRTEREMSDQAYNPPQPVSQPPPKPMRRR